MNFDFTSWKSIKISELFNISKYGDIKKVSDINFGSTPFVSTTEFNNGISKYIDKKPNNKGGCITLAIDGKPGICFWQQEDFCRTTNVCVLRNVNLNKYNSLFLCTILKFAFMNRFSYGIKMKKEGIIENEKIFLPFEGNEINWKYMEDYIKDIYISNQKIYSSAIIRDTKKINFVNWKEFKLENIFSIKATLNGIDKNKLLLNGEKKYPFVSRSEGDLNGINDYIPKQDKQINEGNCISVGLDTQTVFYQLNDFYTGQNINILRWEGINKYNALFIVSILRFVIKKLYSWGGNGATLGRLRNTKIWLPAKNDKPDYKYMEKYIKSLKNSDLI